MVLLERKYLREHKWNELEELTENHINYAILEARPPPSSPFQTKKQKKAKEETWKKIQERM